MLLIGSLLPSTAHAQDYDRIAPKTLSEPAPPEVTRPRAPPPVAASDKIILPMLNGLVFVSDAANLQTAGLPASTAGPTGISAPGLPLLADPGFTAQVSPFLGKPLSMNGLNKIVQAADGWYRGHDQLFVAVAVPPQDLANGVVQVLVTPYRVGQVHAEGNKWFSDDLLIAESGLTPGTRLTPGDVQDDLEWLNDNPFRTVTPVFEPGKAPAETDVVLRTEDRFPLRVYAGFDNAGVAYLGRLQWNTGFNWDNMFGLDQLLSYQFTRSFSARYNAHSLNWTIPLPWRDRLIVFGSFAQERPDYGPFSDDPGADGQASLRYVHDLPDLSLTSGIALTEDIQVGYDFKTTNNNLEFGGIRVFRSEVEVDQFPVIYDLTETDKHGQTVIENQLVFSPGGMTAGNNDRAFRIETPRSAANYFYDRVTLTRTTALPAEFSWVARVIAQAATANLQYSEQLSAGGAGSVRGYYTDTATESEGVLVSQEIRTPDISLSKLLRQTLPDEDKIWFGMFWDYGHVSQVDDAPGLVNSAVLSSVGLDSQLTVGRYLDFRVDAGWQLRSAPGSNDRSVFIDLAATVGF